MLEQINLNVVLYIVINIIILDQYNSTICLQ